MTSKLLTILLCCTSLLPARAQMPVRYFELKPPEHGHKVRGSLYSHIEFMESRNDSVMIGFVQTGPLNNLDARLVFRKPIQPQLEALLSAQTDSAAGPGTLLFQLRNFSFIETFGSRYLVLKATIYARTDSGYEKLLTLDEHTVIRDTYILDAATTYGRAVLTGFIDSALTTRPSGTDTYTLADIRAIDSIEKSRLPLYRSSTFVDGIYLTYASFSKQLPDRQGMIKGRKDGSVVSVRVLDDNANKVRLAPKTVYAVVYRGKPFIATPFGYYPLEKARDNFYFTGDVRIAATSRDVAVGQMAFGLLGAIDNAVGFRKTYDILLDPENGKFIHLRLIPQDR